MVEVFEAECMLETGYIQRRTIVLTNVSSGQPLSFFALDVFPEENIDHLVLNVKCLLCLIVALRAPHISYSGPPIH